jgi:hypothetical protein
MPTIGAAVNQATKDLFEAAADARTTTASRLAASLIAEFLERETDELPPAVRPAVITSLPAGSHGGARTEQVFVRLEPFYFAELQRLAKERNWYRGTYLANLLYAHVDRRPVLCDREVDAVHQVARQLADIGRNINQIAKKLNTSAENAHLVRAMDFDLIRILIDLETTTVKDLIRGNVRGWGVDDGQA